MCKSSVLKIVQQRRKDSSIATQNTYLNKIPSITRNESRDCKNSVQKIAQSRNDYSFETRKDHLNKIPEYRGISREKSRSRRKRKEGSKKLRNTKESTKESVESLPRECRELEIKDNAQGSSIFDFRISNWDSHILGETPAITESKLEDKVGQVLDKSFEVLDFLNYCSPQKSIDSIKEVYLPKNEDNRSASVPMRATTNKSSVCSRNALRQSSSSDSSSTRHKSRRQRCTKTAGPSYILGSIHLQRSAGRLV